MTNFFFREINHEGAWKIPKAIRGRAWSIWPRYFGIPIKGPLVGTINFHRREFFQLKRQGHTRSCCLVKKKKRGVAETAEATRCAPATMRAELYTEKGLNHWSTTPPPIMLRHYSSFLGEAKLMFVEFSLMGSYPVFVVNWIFKNCPWIFQMSTKHLVFSIVRFFYYWG